MTKRLPACQAEQHKLMSHECCGDSTAMGVLEIFETRKTHPSADNRFEEPIESSVGNESIQKPSKTQKE
ncbi:MAG: hypothetical protein AAF412_12095 [Pseudomonadota bacterium]